MCSFSILPCLVASSSPLQCCNACYLATLIFNRCQHCSLAINQISLSESKGLFPFVLLCRQENYHWTDLLGLHINYINMISELDQPVVEIRKNQLVGFFYYFQKMIAQQLLLTAGGFRGGGAPPPPPISKSRAEP